jgi:O-acetyl-ADP-ribose deacetylase (regulator of RNase III)
MPDEHAIIEVVATQGGVKVPLGMAGVKQALNMPGAGISNILTPNMKQAKRTSSLRNTSWRNFHDPRE